ncbi:hypothetical protein ESCO47_00146 [Escherichia phage vB_EcoM_ESCO47]|nr:hypothetical protein ESCO47_00146 [Escherichia phage vB_EcoM_ESCO47]
MYGTLIKPLKIKEPKMAIKIGKTYKLVEPEIKTPVLVASYHTLSLLLGDEDFEIVSFKRHVWFEGYEITTRHRSSGRVENITVYTHELELFEELVQKVVEDPTDLLCKAVSIRRPFDNRRICGWVTDQWIEDGVELLNVVHDGDFTVCPRSAVVNVLN